MRKGEKLRGFERQLMQNKLHKIVQQWVHATEQAASSTVLNGIELK